MRQGITVFPVRHLSPACAFHLRNLLDELRPTAVLVEGPSDANAQIKHITGSRTQLPVAILAYTEEYPIKTILYPLAVYSPEYQAVLWAEQHGAQAEFVDLPSGTTLALASSEPGKESPGPSVSEVDIYGKWAELAGEPDHETYWERTFEHNPGRSSFVGSLNEFGKGLRSVLVQSPRQQAVTLVREAFMRHRIDQALAAGHRPEKIAVVTGAFHAGALGAGLPTMSAEEIRTLPAMKTRLTLMPYSYFKLSFQSGYGAGNLAPQYFEMVWDHLCRREAGTIGADYLARVAGDLRERGTFRSTADVIEGVRLAQALAGQHGEAIPALKDLEDAAVTCLGNGEVSTVAESLARTNVGARIGSLEEGISQTSVQNDFNEQVRQLKLERFKSSVAHDLALDLRENRRVKSEESAFLDLNRSVFFHRLRVLNVGFATYRAALQDSATWKELWALRWTPEVEIALVETTLLGETIELALAFQFRKLLKDCVRVNQAAAVVRDSCICNMKASMEEARTVLQDLAVDAGAFPEIAEAVFNLSQVIDYKDIRNIDTAPLLPLLKQLFLRGALLLDSSSNCDHAAATTMFTAMDQMNRAALKHHQIIDEPVWVQQLRRLSDRDDRNARLSGFACALLLERDLVNGEQLSSEVSRRLSPGIDPDLGAGWFEGLALRNRYALLSRLDLWRELDTYVNSLGEEEFKRALVFLRRSFGPFSRSEKAGICENLGELWKVAKDRVSEAVFQELSAEEKQKIKKLDEFDFGDL